MEDAECRVEYSYKERERMGLIITKLRDQIGAMSTQIENSPPQKHSPTLGTIDIPDLKRFSSKKSRSRSPL